MRIVEKRRPEPRMNNRGKASRLAGNTKDS